MESAVGATNGILGAGGDAVGDRHHPGSVSDPNGTTEILRASGALFFVYSVLPDTGTLAWICVVPARTWVRHLAICNSATLHFQWEIVLGTRTTIWRYSFRALRQP